MVGDKATDVLAGAAFGLRTALVVADRRAAAAELAARGVQPFFQGRDLRDFARFVLDD
jgi:predicted HAD superfamily phosphohydrolase YqeG